MSVIRVGSSNTYAEGWDAIFGGRTKRTGVPAGKKKATATATKQKSNKGLGGGRKPSPKPPQVKSRRRK